MRRLVIEDGIPPRQSKLYKETMSHKTKKEEVEEKEGTQGESNTKTSKGAKLMAEV